MLLLGIQCCVLFEPVGQGTIHFSSVGIAGNTATRIGSIDGELAGRGYYAQLLAGTSERSLSPIGSPTEHLAAGLY